MDNPITFRHKYELTIKIGARTTEDLESALHGIAFNMYEKDQDGVTGPVSIVSGSPSAGYTVTGDIDPTWTKERHNSELMAWAERQKEVRRG